MLKLIHNKRYVPIKWQRSNNLVTHMEEHRYYHISLVDRQNGTTSMGEKFGNIYQYYKCHVPTSRNLSYCIPTYPTIVCEIMYSLQYYCKDKITTAIIITNTYLVVSMVPLCKAFDTFSFNPPNNQPYGVELSTPPLYRWSNKKPSKSSPRSHN